MDAAAAADAVVLVVGTTGEWESEGDDRPSMDLPGRQDELVRRVLAANPSTVVVLNAASPVTMDWAADARAVLHTSLGGQEMAAALADVLLGEAEPAGRLPTTIPLRLEHNPSYGNFPGENGHVALRRGRAGRLPLVRGPPPAGAVPVRPRRLVHDVPARRARGVGGDVRAGPATRGAGSGHQHR